MVPPCWFSPIMKGKSGTVTQLHNVTQASGNAGKQDIVTRFYFYVDKVPAFDVLYGPYYSKQVAPKSH